MKLEHLTITGMMVASGLLAGSCALDERELAVAVSDLGIGGGANGGAGGNGEAPLAPDCRSARRPSIWAG
jgi:hypothetical protein